MGSGGELHPRTGRLVSLSACGRTARRQQPGQEFNHGLVLSREPLRDGRVFTVRIDRKVRSGARGTEMWRAVGGGERETRGRTSRLAHVAGYRQTFGAPGDGQEGRMEQKRSLVMTGRGMRRAGVSCTPRSWAGTRGCIPRNA